jgi:hypothetical protein
VKTFELARAKDNEQAIAAAAKSKTAQRAGGFLRERGTNLHSAATTADGEVA